MTVTSQICAFVERTRTGAMPDEVLADVDLALIDTVASMLAGVPFPAARAISESPLHRTHGELEATLIGFGGRRSLLDTVVIHGLLAHIADFDDVSWGLMGHPSATLVPALLSLAEVVDASGDQLARAYVAGYEVDVELGHATAPGHYLRGWHATATIGTIGVAAAASTLLGLDTHRISHAVGIAASSSSGLRQNFGSDVKSLHAGFAARNGVAAALLARDGLTADAHAIDGRWGFFRAFDDAEDGTLRPGAFTSWNILEPGTLRKLYPSCGATHQAIDAARRLHSERPVPWENIESVEVGVAPACFAPLIPRLPTTPLEGKFSMPFTIATALLDGDVRTRHFTVDHLESAAVQGLMPRIGMVPDPALADIPENRNDASAARVTVRYGDGTTASAEARFPSGAPENPLSVADLDAKFLDAGEPVLGAAGAADALTALRRLRSSDSVASTLHLLEPA